ncbi:alcohol dehydrogenase catalytic domain-containing protein [Asanoa sp. NPDC050611]|uniref:zinc-dependent alcohol dehydrogenase n=1 Tax=Asanoa sp. NPDC050611 TaxID=3157098 RepID=UPI0033DBEFD6
MRALVFQGPGRLHVEARPDPVPGPGEVLLDVIATGICGSDLHGYTGQNGRRFPGQVMGHETVARVRAGGALAPGTLVTVNPVLACGDCAACRADSQQRCPRRRVIGVDPAISSAFAEQIAVPGDNVVPLADDLPPPMGALVEPLSVGYHAARRGGVTADAAVLVIGGGPIGQAAALAAERLGARTLVSEPDATRSALLRTLGFPVVTPAAPDLGDRVVAALGVAPTVVVDAVGNTRSLGQALELSDPGATVVLVGMDKPRVDLAAYQISTEERTIVGSFCYTAGEFRGTAEWLAAESGRLAALVDVEVDLEAAPDTFAELAAGRMNASKVLVRTGA